MAQTFIGSQFRPAVGIPTTSTTNTAGQLSPATSAPSGAPSDVSDLSNTKSFEKPFTEKLTKEKSVSMEKDLENGGPSPFPGSGSPPVEKFMKDKDTGEKGHSESKGSSETIPGLPGGGGGFPGCGKPPIDKIVKDKDTGEKGFSESKGWSETSPPTSPPAGGGGFPGGGKPPIVDKIMKDKDSAEKNSMFEGKGLSESVSPASGGPSSVPSTRFFGAN